MPLATACLDPAAAAALLWADGRAVEAVQTLAFARLPSSPGAGSAGEEGVSGGGGLTPVDSSLDFLLTTGLQQLAGRWVLTFQALKPSQRCMPASPTARSAHP